MSNIGPDCNKAYGPNSSQVSGKKNACSYITKHDGSIIYKRPVHHGSECCCHDECAGVFYGGVVDGAVGDGAVECLSESSVSSYVAVSDNGGGDIC